jgi:hypothetical protein
MNCNTTRSQRANEDRGLLHQHLQYADGARLPI